MFQFREGRSFTFTTHGAQLAERASTTQSYIGQLAAGTLDPGTGMLARLAEAPRMLFCIFNKLQPDCSVVCDFSAGRYPVYPGNRPRRALNRSAI